MSITVGTDAYDMVANADAYWLDRANADWASSSLGDKEVNLRKATDWIERNFRFRGVRATGTQRLAWPRERAFDDDGYAIGLTSAPLRVKESMYIVADIYRAGTNDLEGIVTSNDASVVKQKVDVIEIEYDANSRIRGADVLSHIYELLGPTITANSLLRT